MIRTTNRLCSSRNLFVPELVRPLACSPRLVFYVLFFKLSIPYIGSLDKSHTGAFNALIQQVVTFTFQTCSVKRGFYAIANSIDPRQSALLVQADMDQNISLSFNFLRVNRRVPDCRMYHLAPVSP